MATQPTQTKPSTRKAAQPMFPRQGNWTYEQWLRFPDDGWRYEIIDGVLHMAPPPATEHQAALVELVTTLNLFVKENGLGRILAAPTGVRLPQQSVPLEPDILFIKKERLDIIKKNYVEGAPDLIIEILSPSNADYDRETKFAAYQAAAVSEYWLVDYQARRVEVYTLRDEVYHLAGDYKADDAVTSTVLEALKIPIYAIFTSEA